MHPSRRQARPIRSSCPGAGADRGPRGERSAANRGQSVLFKNLALYRMSAPLALSPEEIGARLAPAVFRPCGGLEPFSYGFEPPLGRDGSGLVHAAHGRMMVCARREERVLPPAVIRETSEARIADIEAREFRTVHRKERRRIRDDVTFELLPRAFTRSVRTYAYLCPLDGWLVIDAASPSKAEALVNLFAQAVEELSIVPYLPDTSPVAAMTQWLRRGELPSGFSLRDECELRDPAHAGSLVRCQRQDLTSEEIRAHLEARKEVRRLGLGFEEHLTFGLTAELQVRRLRFEGVEALDEQAEADAAARFDADFAFMSATLAPLLARLLRLFGEAG
jgi:recombination associated protein RdgC